MAISVLRWRKNGDRIVESLKTASESLRIGPGLSTENEPDLGPLIAGITKEKLRAILNQV